VSPKQTSLYWREWQAVRGAIACANDDLRHQLHLDALGCDKSSKEFTNSDLDKVLATFRAITQADDIDVQVEAQRQPRRRLINRITQGQHAQLAAILGSELAADNYLLRILRERFSTDDLTLLNTEHLEQLRNTLATRIRHLEKTAALTHS
jgi:hypothetical protein